MGGSTRCNDKKNGDALCQKFSIASANGNYAVLMRTNTSPAQTEIDVARTEAILMSANEKRPKEGLEDGIRVGSLEITNGRDEQSDSNTNIG